MMFPDDPDSKAFPLYEYTILDETAVSINWSPSNDLCVLVHQDNSLAVCRAGITPIWSTKLNSTVTCVAWHPNGQEFVFGCQDGTVSRLNTAHLAPNPVRCWPPSEFDFGSDVLFSISSLLWIDYTPNGPTPNVPNFDPNAFDMEEHLPGLSMVPPVEPMPLKVLQRSEKEPLPQRLAKINDSLSLLLVGDQNGSLHLSLNGSYHIGTIPCVPSSSMRSVVNIDISQDLDRTQVLIQDIGTKAYNLITLDTQVLRRKKAGLCNVASVEHEIDYLLQYIQHCTKTLESHHIAYTNLAKQNADQISKNLNDANDDAIPLPQVELLGLLATGNLNPAVHKYLNGDEMDQQKAKQWETRSMHSYTNVQRIIIEYLQPACERLLLQLSKLRGYGLWTERYEELICNDSVATAIELTQQYTFTAQQLLKSAGQVSRRFQEFITWIYKVVQRIADQAQPDYQGNSLGPLYQSPNLIMEYLMEDFVTDSLAAFFTDSTSKKLSPTNDDISRTGSMSIAPLPSTLSELVKRCKMISGRPANILPQLVKHLDDTQLNLAEADGKTYIANQSNGRSVAFHMKEDETKVHQYYAFIQNGSNGAEQVSVVHLFWDKATNHKGGPLLSSQLSPPGDPIGKEHLLIDIESNWCITDIEFLDNKELALLLQQQGTHYDMTEIGDQDVGPRTFLTVIEYVGLPYHSLHEAHLIPTSSQAPLKLAETMMRYMELPNMNNATMGINGREKRRIMAVAASNGLFQVLELDKGDDDEEDDGDDDDDDE